jgi:pimeloyl-ACP methyl ester carboxylesterase
MNKLLKRSLFSALILAGVFVYLPAQAAPAVDLKGENVVLVHGAFADGSSWAKVIPLLQARGLNVVAVQNPTTSLADDVTATKRVVEKLTGPVVLVGHSWGGQVITQAGNDDKVDALVYVSAFAVDNGQSINDLLKGLPPPVWASALQKDSGSALTLTTQGIVDDFAQDLSPTQQHVIAATQTPWPAAAIDDKVTTAAWHTKPSWFVISDKDRMIDPKLQAAMAHTIGATVSHANTSHLPMFKDPQAVADAIIAAATKVRQAQ